LVGAFVLRREQPEPDDAEELFRPRIRRQEEADTARGKVCWHVALRHSERRALPNTRLGRITEKIETLKASIRARIEHPFHIVKNRFGHRRTRYRGLAKNASQLFTLFGLANLLIAKKAILAGAA
jgi:transposase, IS5 family